MARNYYVIRITRLDPADVECRMRAIAGPFVTQLDAHRHVVSMLERGGGEVERLICYYSVLSPRGESVGVLDTLWDAEIQTTERYAWEG